MECVIPSLPPFVDIHICIMLFPTPRSCCTQLMAGELHIAPPSPALPAMRLLQRPRLPTQGLSSLCRRALLLPRCPPTASSSSSPGSHDACAPSMTTSACGGSGATQQPRLPPRALLDALAAYPAITVAQVFTDPARSHPICMQPHPLHRCI